MCISLYTESLFANETNTNEWGSITNNTQMSIKLDGNVAGLTKGQTLILSIRYKNISTNDTITIYEVNGTVDDSSYSFSIISPSGKDISPDMTKVSNPWSGAVRNVEPGHVIDIKYNLSKYCKLNEVGTYTIMASKTGIQSSNNPNSYKTISNQLNVMVVSDK